MITAISGPKNKSFQSLLYFLLYLFRHSDSIASFSCEVSKGFLRCVPVIETSPDIKMNGTSTPCSFKRFWNWYPEYSGITTSETIKFGGLWTIASVALYKSVLPSTWWYQPSLLPKLVYDNSYIPCSQPPWKFTCRSKNLSRGTSSFSSGGVRFCPKLKFKVGWFWHWLIPVIKDLILAFCVKVCTSARYLIALLAAIQITI